MKSAGKVAMSLLLAKYWKHLAVTGLILLVVSGLYLKGRADCNRAHALATEREIARRMAEWEKSRVKIDDKITAIQKHRSSTPVDDDRDSCLLSGNPLETSCIKP